MHNNVTNKFATFQLLCIGNKCNIKNIDCSPRSTWEWHASSWMSTLESTCWWVRSDLHKQKKKKQENQFLCNFCEYKNYEGNRFLARIVLVYGSQGSLVSSCIFLLIEVQFLFIRRLSHSVQRSRPIHFRLIPNQRLDWQHWYLNSLPRNQLRHQVITQFRQPNVEQI